MLTIILADEIITKWIDVFNMFAKKIRKKNNPTSVRKYIIPNTINELGRFIFARV